MTKITISGDLPLWALPMDNKIVKTFNDILKDDLQVYYDSKGNMFLMTDDEVKTRPMEVQNGLRRE